MNGVHDMGGMQGMGPIEYEDNEPVFHERWEARLYAVRSAITAWGKWNLDAWRHTIELLPAADYLRMSYYEKWLAAFEKLLVDRGLVSGEELATGKPAPGSPKAKPVLTADAARRIVRNIPSSKDPAVLPKFKAGDRVRARNMHPTGHTRLPRYARGKLGVIWHDHGVYTFPDTNSRYEGEHRQHVYSVRFAARELWGEQASPCDSVYIDLWDDYLEHT
jgi:nitrile hydratase beta subunit